MVRAPGTRKEKNKERKPKRGKKEEKTANVKICPIIDERIVVADAKSTAPLVLAFNLPAVYSYLYEVENKVANDRMLFPVFHSIREPQNSRKRKVRQAHNFSRPEIQKIPGLVDRLRHAAPNMDDVKKFWTKMNLAWFKHGVVTGLSPVEYCSLLAYLFDHLKMPQLLAYVRSEVLKRPECVSLMKTSLECPGMVGLPKYLIEDIFADFLEQATGVRTFPDFQCCTKAQAKEELEMKRATRATQAAASRAMALEKKAKELAQKSSEVREPSKNEVPVEGAESELTEGVGDEAELKGMKLSKDRGNSKSRARAARRARAKAKAKASADKSEVDEPAKITAGNEPEETRADADADAKDELYVKQILLQFYLSDSRDTGSLVPINIDDRVRDKQYVYFVEL